MAQDWTDRIVGARMSVDSEFEDRLQQSEFSRQEWGLVMTAVEFDIEHPNDPDRARIVADTDNLGAIMPELDRISEMTPMGATKDSGSSGGIFDSVKNALGFGGDGNAVDEEKRRRAAQLANEYASDLQQHLEHRGKWDEIRTIASDNEATES
ncbi:DUF5799 family protein [Halocatena marina]|uniref:DUF5799 family protein n=1 Tax=Halocatena marina TaxID=2934937 RepID=A0ABD5YR17_9EURY|nr:DUF5799 family protein [Halocatena marina]